MFSHLEDQDLALLPERASCSVIEVRIFFPIESSFEAQYVKLGQIHVYAFDVD